MFIHSRFHIMLPPPRISKKKKETNSSSPLPSPSPTLPAPLLEGNRMLSLGQDKQPKRPSTQHPTVVTRSPLCSEEDFHSQRSSQGPGSALSPPLHMKVTSRKGRRTGVLGTRQDTNSRGGDIQVAAASCSIRRGVGIWASLRRHSSGRYR